VRIFLTTAAPFCRFADRDVRVVLQHADVAAYRREEAEGSGRQEDVDQVVATGYAMVTLKSISAFGILPSQGSGQSPRSAGGSTLAAPQTSAQHIDGS
jgi:hypothetical protein